MALRPIREQIAAVFAARLSTTITGVTIERGRLAPVVGAAAPIVVRAGRHDVDHGVTGITLYTMALMVEATAQGTRAAVRAALDDLRRRIVAAVLADTRLGGLATDLQLERDDIALDKAKGGKATGTLTLRFRCDFVTAVGDPYHQPSWL